MALDHRFAPARAVSPGGAGRRAEPGAGDAARPPVAQRVLALQRLAGNRATQAALGRASARALQRLVLTTARPPQRTDSPRDIADKHEVDLAANALSGAWEPSYIEDPTPDLDAEKVNYVVGHSDGREKIGDFTVEQLAELLVGRGMTDQMVVRLVACNTGVGVGDTVPMAARLAVELHEKYRLNDFAVKGARGVLLKTKRSDQQGPGVSGAYKLEGHPQLRPGLARPQSVLMDKLATHLVGLITQLEEQAYTTIKKDVLAIFDVFEARSDVEGTVGREQIASKLGEKLRKVFHKRASLVNTQDDFNGVMKSIEAIAGTDAGKKRSLTTAGGSKSFAQLVNESTQTYFAECKTLVEDWLASIPKAEGTTAKKLPRGNISYKFGTLNPFMFSESYTEALELRAADTESVQGHEQ